MCKTLISCSYRKEDGQVKNIRLDSSQKLVGDFRGTMARHFKVVNFEELVFLNKKAEKKAREIRNSFKKPLRLQPERKVAV